MTIIHFLSKKIELYKQQLFLGQVAFFKYYISNN